MPSDDVDDAINTPSARQRRRQSLNPTTNSTLLRAPPSYSSLLPDSASASVTTTRRNSIQPSVRPPVEHRYSLTDSHKAPWATLILRSNVASPQLLPAYFEGQTLNGSLELKLPKPETILGIHIEVSGKIVANALSPFTFWKHIHPLWTPQMGDPNTSVLRNLSEAENTVNTSMESIPLSLSSLSIQKKSKKLSGEHIWPFAITLPSTCNISTRAKQPPVVLRLPPSFSEKGAAQFINYELNVRIRRGIFRIDSQLGTHFGFVPRVRPSAPSPKRSLAYQNGSPPPTPKSDPEGWHILQPIMINGKVFGVREVKAKCEFAFSKPLVYTRGSPIPCSLCITCSDPQALDLLSNPSSTALHLIREIRYNTDSSLSFDNKEGGPWAPSHESSPSDLSLGIPAGTPSISTPFSILSSKGASQSDMNSSISKEKPRNKERDREALQPPKFGPMLTMNGARKGVASAVWWPNNSRRIPTVSVSSEPSYERYLDGEILLPKDLVPNFSFGGFTISYYLLLLPYRIPGFELKSFSLSPPSSPSSSTSSPSSPAKSPPTFNPISNVSASSSKLGTASAGDPLFLTQVDIATLHAPGPAARLYAPPGAHEAKARAGKESENRPAVWGLCI